MANLTKLINKTVTLSDGLHSKDFVVIGFNRTHAHLAKKADWNESVNIFGSYNTTVYGYTAWNLRSGAIQKGFFELLEK